MGTQKTAGFTIIETVLFLSITGLLIVGVLIGTGRAINIQRYRDATETFKSLLQEQYADLSSVRNGRDDTWGCAVDARPIQDGNENRGQSNCAVVGKHMAITNGAIVVRTVLAHERATSTSATDDVTIMRENYRYSVSDVEVENLTMEWQTQIAYPKDWPGTPQTPRSMSLLFIRSPNSGSIYTFSNSTAPAPSTPITSDSLIGMMVTGASVPGQGERTICVLSDGLMPSGDMAVYIAPYASNASAVETRSNDLMTQLGVATRC